MKKGFTLVELLAVIVILALLIVITANTVLPMMNKTKQKAMIVYASKVLQKANEAYLIDSMTNNGSAKYYSIEELMGQDNYHGGVRVENVDGKYEYSIEMFDAKEGLGLKPPILESTSIVGDIDKIVSKEYYNETKNDKEKYDTDEDVENLEFFVGINLIDFNRLVDNKYIGSSGGDLGVEKNDDDWIATDYISVEAEKKYTFTVNKIKATRSAGYAWFASNKTKLSGGNYPADNITQLTLTAPLNAKYLRVSWIKEENPDYQNTVSIKKQV